MNRMALLSDEPEPLYRYTLSRTWDVLDDRRVLFIMLNPSIADASIDDPTIRKCIGFGKRWGFGGLYVGNLFARRSTDPNALLDVERAGRVGPDNDLHLVRLARSSSLIVCAWGAHKAVRVWPERVKAVLDILAVAGMGRPVRALKLSKEGHPFHPLYVPYDTELIPFGGRAA